MATQCYKLLKIPIGVLVCFFHRTIVIVIIIIYCPGTSLPGISELLKCRSMSLVVITGTQKLSTSCLGTRHHNDELLLKLADIRT